MDTTYFGRDFGVMVLMDSISQRVLSVDEVKYETNALYAAALTALKEKGVEIQSIVCDGRKGLLQMFPGIPAQLCQFHQVKTVSRYLTRNPKTAAGKALWRLALTLKDSRKAAFQGALQAWFEQHEGFLNERTVNEETGKLALHAQDAEKCVFEPETEPGLPVYLRGASGTGHAQHHQFAGWALCRLKAQIGVSSRDEKRE